MVFGESAASQQGDDAVSWLTKNFKQGRATGGQGAETVLVLDPAIRTTAGANLRAEGILQRHAAEKGPRRYRPYRHGGGAQYTQC